MAHKPLFGTSTRVESDILGLSDGKKLGHYAGTINLRELETPSKTGEIAEFDGHLAGQFNGPHSFDLKGTINRAGGVLFDKIVERRYRHLGRHVHAERPFAAHQLGGS